MGMYIGFDIHQIRTSDPEPDIDSVPKNRCTYPTSDVCQILSKHYRNVFNINSYNVYLGFLTQWE
jgi:hypothetical protein